jgi:hypothetical protein
MTTISSFKSTIRNSPKLMCYVFSTCLSRRVYRDRGAGIAA